MNIPHEPIAVPGMPNPEKICSVCGALLISGNKIVDLYTDCGGTDDLSRNTNKRSRSIARQIVERRKP